MKSCLLVKVCKLASGVFKLACVFSALSNCWAISSCFHPLRREFKRLTIYGRERALRLIFYDLLLLTSAHENRDGVSLPG